MVSREAPADAPEEVRGKIAIVSGVRATGPTASSGWPWRPMGAWWGTARCARPRWAMPPGVGEIGIALFDDRTGKGYGTDAIRVLCARLFDDDGLHRVQLSTDVGNQAMRRAAEKAGFTFEGVLRGFWRQDDGIHDYAMYGRSLADHEGGR